MRDLVDVLDRSAPLVSRLSKKDSVDWLSDSCRRAQSLGTNMRELGKGPRIHCTEVCFIAKLLGAMHLLTRISQTIIVTTLENYGMYCTKP